MARSAHGESESETRRTRIDPKLIEQGWEVVPYDPNRPLIAYTNHAVTEFPTDDGPADYALFVAGRLLGIVEGKAGHAGAAERPDAGRTVLEGRPEQPVQLSRLPRAVPVLDQRRSRSGSTTSATR